MTDDQGRAILVRLARAIHIFSRLVDTGDRPPLTDLDASADPVAMLGAIDAALARADAGMTRFLDQLAQLASRYPSGTKD